MTITAQQLEEQEYIPNAPIREAVLAAMRRDPELRFSAIASWCGIMRTRGGDRPDSTNLKRMLGLRPHSGSTKMVGKNIKYDMAVRIVREIGIDPVDVGL